METWAEREMQYAQLGDARLNKRLIRIVESLADQPNVSVPQACGNWAATKGTYRFWNSERVSAGAILDSHIKSTLQRLELHGQVLAIQDTTDINFTHHRSAEGLGPLQHPVNRGLMVHSVLTVDTQGVPLGLIDQLVWARDPDDVGSRHSRRRRKTSEKESYKWILGLGATERVIREDTEIITIADREADIYDFMAEPRRAGHELLIRATHNRRVSHEADYLWEVIRQSPEAGQISIELKRSDDRPARQANLSVRYASMAIHPPRNGLSRKDAQPVEVQVVLAEEQTAPAEGKPVCWLLITTLSVRNLQQAVQCLEYYSYRWLIERYHYVLKSGCKIEELQLEKAERINRALATYCIVAWRLLWLTYEARSNPQEPCDTVLKEHEWQSLYCTVHRTPIAPDKPPSLREAVRMIAQLGGFLGRKADGEPGVKTIWRGLRRLSDIADTWKLLHSEPPNNAAPRLMGNA